jgi:hypothetical protein
VAGPRAQLHCRQRWFCRAPRDAALLDPFEISNNGVDASLGPVRARAGRQHNLSARSRSVAAALIRSLPRIAVAAAAPIFLKAVARSVHDS